MVSKSDILNCFININPVGDTEAAIQSVNILLGSNESTPDGSEVTFEYLCESYQKYCDFWDSKWEGTEDRWIPQQDKKKNPWEFINLSMYKQKFELQKTGRDYYLFGNLKLQEIKRQYEIFKKS